MVQSSIEEETQNAWVHFQQAGSVLFSFFVLLWLNSEMYRAVAFESVTKESRQQLINPGLPG